MPLLSFSVRPPAVASAGELPARDTCIPFGKHKGLRLGSLPSSYLRWVSTTLRAGDTERFARLAGTVLADPVYRDRIEWEIAARLLSGEGAKTLSSSLSPSDELLEIGERFGWDYADRDGWAKVDFALLGTSLGGRIPRRRRPPVEEQRVESFVGKDEQFIDEVDDKKCRGLKVGSLKSMHRYGVDDIPNAGPAAVSDRREERRERRKAKQREQMEAVKKKVGSEGDAIARSVAAEKVPMATKNGIVMNPFPGRQNLLNKIKRKES